MRARKPLPIEARLSMRPFILRRRGLALRPVPAAGSTLPAYIFETLLKPIPDPFGFELLPPSGLFIAGPGRNHRAKPVARVDLQGPRLSSNRRSPPGPLDPSGSVRSARLQPGMLALTSCPIFLRSPPRVNSLSTQRETDRRSGSATSRQAPCSSNLLEPTPECTHPGFRSI